MHIGGVTEVQRRCPRVAVGTVVAEGQCLAAPGWRVELTSLARVHAAYHEHVREISLERQLHLNLRGLGGVILYRDDLGVLVAEALLTSNAERLFAHADIAA